MSNIQRYPISYTDLQDILIKDQYPSYSKDDQKSKNTLLNKKKAICVQYEQIFSKR